MTGVGGGRLLVFGATCSGAWTELGAGKQTGFLYERANGKGGVSFTHSWFSCFGVHRGKLYTFD